MTVLMLVLGFIGEMTGGKGIDLLGLGLTGVGGAVVFLAVMGGLGAALVVGVRFMMNNIKYRARLEGILLHVPGWGPAVLAFAMLRFCVTLRITHEAALVPNRNRTEAAGNGATSPL